jgi:hypothetical protein
MIKLGTVKIKKMIRCAPVKHTSCISAFNLLSPIIDWQFVD